MSQQSSATPILLTIILIVMLSPVIMVAGCVAIAGLGIAAGTVTESRERALEQHEENSRKRENRNNQEPE